MSIEYLQEAFKELLGRHKRALVQLFLFQVVIVVHGLCKGKRDSFHYIKAPNEWTNGSYLHQSVEEFDGRVGHRVVFAFQPFHYFASDRLSQPNKYKTRSISLISAFDSGM